MCWMTGCTQRPRLRSHVSNFMHCFSTRLPGAAKRIPMKKKHTVDLDLQRSRHGGSNAKSGCYTLKVKVRHWSWTFKAFYRLSGARNFFFGLCCARHNDSGSHENMLNWSSVDNSIAQIGQWTKRKQKQNKQNRPNNQTQTNKSWPIYESETGETCVRSHYLVHSSKTPALTTSSAARRMPYFQ